jgi:uncharacterized membrane protein YraQ (UPF0718 family)
MQKANAVHFQKGISVYPDRLVGIGAVIHNWIPEEWVAAVLGSKNPFGVGACDLDRRSHVCRHIRVIPIAEALWYKGAQLGAIFSFMMAVTNALRCTSMIMLRKAIKPKLLALFIAICMGIIIVG